MNMTVWEYNRAAAEAAASAVSVVTPVTGSYLVIDQINAVETAAVGGEITLKRGGVALMVITINDDSVDLLGGAKIRVAAGSALTLDVGAGIALTMSGTMFSEA